MQNTLADLTEICLILCSCAEFKAIQVLKHLCTQLWAHSNLVITEVALTLLDRAVCKHKILKKGRTAN